MDEGKAAMARVMIATKRVGKDAKLWIEVVRILNHRGVRDTVWWCNGDHVGFLLREDLRETGCDHSLPTPV